MMTRKSSLTIFFIMFIFSSKIFAQAEEWVVGVQKFTYFSNQNTSVQEAVAKMFPARILENLNKNLYRTIELDEQLNREMYSLKNERNSLILQISNEMKKRDSLVLGNYSQTELDKKILEENNKINSIKENLQKNLDRQAEIESLLMSDELQSVENYKTTEKDTQTSLFKNIFSSDSEKNIVEKVSIYKNDINATFSPSEEIKKLDISSSQFEKEIMKEKIDCLLTGNITSYEDYFYVTVEAYCFPGCKKIATITEVGSINDLESISQSIARQLNSAITKSIPSTIELVFIFPEDDAKVDVFIDNILQSNSEEKILITSGIHYIQFVSNGYISLSTNYYFEGNQNYKIQVTFEKSTEKTIYFDTSNFEGDFFVNGIKTQQLYDGKSKISINDNVLLGDFVSKDDELSFFYIPEKLITQNALYDVKVNPINHADYIEKNRRRMYSAYSVLITSLIPTFILNGRVQNLINASGTYIDNQEKIDKTNKMILASNISTGVSITCGIWFAFEMYRYFKAADSVLPEKSKYDGIYIEQLEDEQQNEMLDEQKKDEQLSDEQQQDKTQQDEQVRNVEEQIDHEENYVEEVMQ